MSNLPIQFLDKVNSPELLAYLQQFGEKSYLSAEEINQIRDAINELAQGTIPDAVLKSGTITINGLALTIAANAFAWRINQQSFLTPAEYAVNLTAAANGFYRADIIVGTSTGTYQVIQGNPSATTAIEPDAPDGTIRLAGIVVFGTVVGQPTPTPTNGFVQKSEQYPIPVTGGGGETFTVDSEKGYFEISNYSTHIVNIEDQQGYIYLGREITFRNTGTQALTFQHNATASENNKKFFTFPNGQDFILKPNEILTLKLGTNSRLNYVGTDLVTSGGTFKPFRATYTGGPQEFTLPGGISQVLLVFVNGQMWDDFVQFTYNPTFVTVIDDLQTGWVISIIYAEAPVSALPTYTRAEQNNLFLLKSDYNEVERFLEYKKADLISPNLMIDYVGDKGFADSGVRIDRDYVLEEMSITFGRFVNTSGLLIPVQIRAHEPNASTQSTPVTGTLIKELECFSDPSNVFNKVFDYTFPDEDWSAYTGKFITVNTANFILGGSTLEDVLVTIKLRKK